MADYSNLKAKANEIKNETVQGMNTATRVGTLFNDIIDALGQVETTIPTSSGVVVTPLTTTGTNIADIIVDGQTKHLYSGLSLNQPLTGINSLNSNPSSQNSMLYYTNSSWTFKTLDQIAESINQYFSEHNYYTIGADVTVTPTLTEGTKIGSIKVGNSTKDLFAPEPLPEGLLIEHVTVTPSLTSGTEIATIKIDNVTKTLYAPVPSTGVSLNQPLSGINNANLGTPSTTDSVISWNGSAWVYKTISGNGGQGSEPAAYLKSAAVSGNTLTLTNKDNTTVTFTPSSSSGSEPAAYIKDAEVSGTTLILTKKDNSTVSFSGGGGGGVVNVNAYYNSGRKLATVNSTDIYLGAINWSDIPDRPTIPDYDPFDDSAIWDKLHELESAKEAAERAVDKLEDDLATVEDDFAKARKDLDDAVQYLEDTKQELKDEIKAVDDALTLANTTAQTEYAKLDNIVNNIDQTITDQVDELFRDAQWVQEHISENVTEWKEEWDAEIGRYLNTVGVWTKDANGFTTTEWSQLKQTANTASLQVNKLIQGDNYTEAFQSFLNQKIKDGVASMKLGTLYAEKDAETVLRWLYSGLMGETSNNTTWANLVSAAKDGGSTAISNLQTKVVELASGVYVAESSLESKVNNVISGLFNKATDDMAYSQLFSKVNQNTDDIATIATLATGDTSQATVAVKFQNFRSGLMTKADWETASASLVTTSNLQEKAIAAGLMLQSTWDTASANLITTTNLQEKGVAAGLMLKSTWDAAQANLVTTSNIADKAVAAGLLLKSGLDGAIGELLTKTGSYVAGFITKTNLSSSITELLAKTNTSSAAVNLRSGLDSAIAELISKTGNAISGIAFRTDIDAAKSELTTNYTAAIGNATTGLLQTSKLGEALASLTASAGNSVSGLVTTAGLTAATASFLTSTDLTNAGYITESTLEGAVARMFAADSDGSTIAEIVTRVNNSVSTVAIKADKIDLRQAGTTFFSTISGSNAFITNAFIDNLYASNYFIQKLTANEIITSLITGMDGKITIDADNVIIGQKSTPSSSINYYTGNTLDKYFEIVSGNFYQHFSDQSTSSSTAAIAMFDDAVLINSTLHAWGFNCTEGQFGNDVLIDQYGLNFTKQNSSAVIKWTKGPGSFYNTIIGFQTIQTNDLDIHSLSIDGTTIDLSSYSELLDNFNSLCSNWTFNNNGTVNQIIANSISIGESGNAIITYYSPDYQIQVSENMWIQGNVEITGDFVVGNDIGVSGTYTLGNKTVKISGGIITSVS